MASKTDKTDNHDPAAKLALRRHFLREYHADGPINVLDCCQGGGLLWGRLREEFDVATYWGVDLKPKKGRLKIDSVRILAQPGWPQNVVDIDTYGSPWKHYFAALPNVSRPTTVFLTIGQRVLGTVGKLAKEAIEAMGLGPIRNLLPGAFSVKLSEYSVSCCLAKAYDHGIIIVDAAEAVTSNRNVRYIGLRLEPSKANGRGAVTPGRSEHNSPIQEASHV